MCAQNWLFASIIANPFLGLKVMPKDPPPIHRRLQRCLHVCNQGQGQSDVASNGSASDTPSAMKEYVQDRFMEIVRKNLENGEYVEDFLYICGVWAL